MKEVELLPHNSEAHEKLITTLKTNNIVSINHATGTGKSFILLKYMLEHNDKKIMFMAPTYPITDQIINEHPKELGFSAEDLSHVDTMIYPNLIKIKDIEEFVKKYDVFIFDEYHRCGSKTWGRIINKIKELIKTKYPNKIIIGTTATEIRYLDNEKDMKDLLFDGVEASRLTLEDAILKGILPVPYYINYDFEELEKLDQIEARVKKYIFDQNKLDVILDRISAVKHQITDIIINSEDVKKYIKNSGKYLVFSSSITNISKDKNKIKTFFPNCDIVEYVVNSNFSREQNLETIERFRNAQKDGRVHILYSVNMLSEGLHIKDVDAEFQCRKTTSPIIYFQHIGRILSYSQRNKPVVIYDLVNNLHHHKVIYNLYSNLVTRAKQLIKIDKNNATKYEEIISKLHIVDKSSKMHQIIDELDEEYSKEKLIASILDESIEKLENRKNVSYLQLSQTESIIKKYYRYIDIKLFERIKNLGILLSQPLFKYSVNEFANLLGNNENLYELLNCKYKKSYKKIKKFLSENYRIPSIFSLDEEEQELAIEMGNYYSKYKKSQQAEIVSYITEDDSDYERLAYKLKITSKDFQQLLSEIEYVMTLNIPIDVSIIRYLKRKGVEDETLEKLKQYNKSLLSKQLNESFNEGEITFIKLYPGESSDYFIKMSNDILKQSEVKGLETILEESYQKIVQYIKKYKEIPVYEKKIDRYGLRNFDQFRVQKALESRKLYFLMTYLNKLFDTYGYTSKIEESLLSVKKAEKDSVVESVIQFMKNNNYNLPSVKSDSKKETYIAYEYQKIKGHLTKEKQEELDKYISLFTKTKDDIVQRMYNFIIINIGKPTTFTQEDLDLIDSYNKFKNNLSTDDHKKMTQAKKISELFYFVIENDFEMPSAKNDNFNEQILANFYSSIKDSITDVEKNIFDFLLTEVQKHKVEFIKKYKSFVIQKRRIPLLNDPEEKKLVFSYNRMLPYLTKEEIDNLKPKVSNYENMKNIYAKMKGKNL